MQNNSPQLKALEQHITLLQCQVTRPISAAQNCTSTEVNGQVTGHTGDARIFPELYSLLVNAFTDAALMTRWQYVPFTDNATTKVTLFHY